MHDPRRRRRVPERRRNRDLWRANTALALEHQSSVHHADMYLAATTVLDRLQRSKRNLRRGTRRRTNLPAIVITTNRLVYGGAERQKALLATELDRRGIRSRSCACNGSGR